MIFNAAAIVIQDFDAVVNKYVNHFSLFMIMHFLLTVMPVFQLYSTHSSIFRGFFHGYSFITVLMILNHALRYISRMQDIVSMFYLS